MALIIAGLGIKFLSHLTKETEKIIQESDKIFYLANDELFPEWIENCNKNTESLYSIYFSKSHRSDSYSLIKEKILSELDNYKNVSFIVYGNPNFLVQITSLVSDGARNNGHEVYVLPAISSFDCLLADLCINPGDGGMQLLEATELLAYRKFIDISSHIVIFQVAAIGQEGHSRDKESACNGLKILCDYLYEFYSGDQQIIFYEASQYPGKTSKIIRTVLKDAYREEISSKTTVYIPPSRKGEIYTEIVNKIKSIYADFDTPSKKSSI